MKIVQISSDDLAGMRFNGFLLGRTLQSLGHDVHMFVRQSESGEPWVSELGNRVVRVVDRLGVRWLERLAGVQSLLPLSAWQLPRSSKLRNADIAHLHLIYNAPFFSLFLLPLLARQCAAVWTIHDQWPLTGHCTYSLACDRWLTGCGQCPDLARPLTMLWDNTAQLFQLKKRLMRQTDIQLVVASDWMRQRVERSPILGHLHCKQIPFGIDLETFRPRDRETCRRAFGVASGNHVLAFRRPRPGNPYKGAECLLHALRCWTPIRRTSLLVYDGEIRDESLHEKYDIVHLGWVRDSEVLAQALNAADVFLMPSLAESFGLMAIEAMACGTPVIVSDNTSLPEIVKAPEGGVTVPNGDGQALATALTNLLSDQGRRDELARAGRRIAEQEYAFDTYVERHLELYREILARRRGSGR